eukprot:scaffold1125_cov374-Pavlova_lutheri.AAC.1
MHLGQFSSVHQSFDVIPVAENILPRKQAGPGKANVVEHTGYYATTVRIGFNCNVIQYHVRCGRNDELQCPQCGSHASTKIEDTKGVCILYFC